MYQKCSHSGEHMSMQCPHSLGSGPYNRSEVIHVAACYIYMEIQALLTMGSNSCQQASSSNKLAEVPIMARSLLFI